MKQFTILYLGLILMLACSSGKRFYHKSDMEIRFGCGGGFTGAVDGCKINGNGEISSYTTLTGEGKSYGKISRKELMAIDKTVSEKGFYDIAVDEAGNMTCFIEILKAGKTEKIYRWPMEKTPSDGKVTSFYTYLKGLREKYVKQ